MQILRIVQAVILMTIVALAASCAASKEYTSKLFNQREPVQQDSQAVALKFLDLDEAETDKENWVTTDIIMGRDTNSGTILALDKLSETLPSNPPVIKKDTSIKKELSPRGEVLVKKGTATRDTVMKANPENSEPVARSSNTVNGVRTKSTRDEK